MIEYRSFLNTDPPLLVEIWRKQASIRGQIEAITHSNFDTLIFSKPYFESAGLILAVDVSDGQSVPLGFVHAGFPPTADLSDLDTTVGIICQLKIVPGNDAQAIASELLKRACEYLKSRGAQRVHAGCKFPYAPFYLGLYGGSQIPGVLVEDAAALSAIQNFGFVEADRIVVFERRLAGFKPVTDRKQIGLRRKYQINALADPLEKSWWESCTRGMTERDRFSIYDKKDQHVCGSVSFWDVQPLAQRWGGLARGMYDLLIPEENRGKGMATFLVGESLRHMMQQGVGLVEAQTWASDLAAIGVFKKLGFDEVSQGVLASMEL